MKKYLYFKFILAIILLGLAGFSAISLAGGKFIQNHVESIYSEELYREAAKIAQDPLICSYRASDSRQEIYKNLSNLASYQSTSIWLISSKGELLLNTSVPFVNDNFPVIEDFNPGQNSGSYYQTGVFYEQFSRSEEHTSELQSR